MKKQSDGIGRRVLRAILAAVAVGVLWWSVEALRDESEGAPFEAAADRISLGQRYRPEMMARAMPLVDQAEQAQQCSRIFRDTAMIRIQARQIAIAAGDAATADRYRDKAIGDLEKDLVCAPTAPASWLFLFTLRASRDGRVGPHLPLLGMAYELGPNEGAIGPVRLRAALPVLPTFGPIMKDYVENDFRMIARDQNAVAADIFYESGPDERAALTDMLQALPSAQRERIVRRLEDERGVKVLIAGQATAK